MVGSVLLVLAAAAAQTPVPASVSVTPATLQLFERDWVLMNWALKYYDSNLDILLSPTEAQRAADAFRKIADADRDGRVTPQEYRAARELVLAGY
jgi:hypothetical protein